MYPSCPSITSPYILPPRLKPGLQSSPPHKNQPMYQNTQYNQSFYKLIPCNLLLGITNPAATSCILNWFPVMVGDVSDPGVGSWTACRFGDDKTNKNSKASKHSRIHKECGCNIPKYSKLLCSKRWGKSWAHWPFPVSKPDFQREVQGLAIAACTQTFTTKERPVQCWHMDVKTCHPSTGFHPSSFHPHRSIFHHNYLFLPDELKKLRIQSESWTRSLLPQKQAQRVLYSFIIVECAYFRNSIVHFKNLSL